MTDINYAQPEHAERHASGGPDPVTPAAIGAATAAALTNEASTARAAESANATAITSEATARANADALLIPLTQKGAASGVASLDGSGKITAAELPAIAINQTYVVASQAAMLALSADVGDTAVRTDTSTTFILAALPASTLANWTQLLSPASPVSSVAGRTGAVTLAVADVTNAVATSDSRLSDSRTPTAHKASHQSGGSDALSLDAAQIGSGTIAQARLGSGSAGTGAKFLADDQTYKTVSGGAVASVNGHTGTVVLAASDVGAVPASDAAPLAQSGQVPSQAPVAPGTTSVGSLAFSARADHVHPSSGLFGAFGDGTDGAATFDGTTTPAGTTKSSSTLYIATRDLNYTSLTGSAGVALDMSGFQLFVRGAAVCASGTFTVTAVPTAVSGTNSGTVPTGGTTNTLAQQRGITLGTGFPGAAGATGAGGSASPAVPVWSGSAAVGGNGGSGSAGAGGTAFATLPNSGPRFSTQRWATALFGLAAAVDAAVANLGSAAVAPMMGGYGGAAGGGDGTNVGGAGGGGGNVVLANLLSVTGNIVVAAPGGAGGTPTVGNCGGGGGGGGGVALLNSVNLSAWTGSVSAAGGAAGGHSGTGASGTAGSAGVARATEWL